MINQNLIKNLFFSLTILASISEASSTYDKGKGKKVNSIQVLESDYLPPEKLKKNNESLKPFANKKVEAPKVQRLMQKDLIDKKIKILSIEGDGMYDGKKITPSSVLAMGEILEMKEGQLSLELPEYGAKMLVRPNTRLVLFKKDHQIGLLKGALVVDKNKGRGFSLHSKNAAIQVMNGKSLTFFKPLLSETEVIVFAGKVQMDNLAEKTDKSLIEKGQWGGIGGRYGRGIGDVLNMPKKFLSKYEKALSK